MIPGLEQITDYKRQASLSEAKKLEEADAVLIHGIYSAAAASEADVPTILLNHGASRKHSFAFQEYLENEDPSKAFFLEENIDRIREELREMFLEPELVTSESYFVKRKLQEYFGVDSHVVHSPIDRDFFRPTRETQDYYFAAERLIWERRPELKIQAFQELDDKLIIAGKGDLEDEVRKMAEETENVEYVGHVQGQDLVDLYSGAKAFVHAGVKDEFPQAVREALACGTPVIAENSGGVPEILTGPELGTVYREEPSPGRLARVIDGFEPKNHRAEILRASTERFSSNRFENKIKALAKTII